MRVTRLKTAGFNVTKRILWVFSGLMALITAELLWWVTFNVRAAQHKRLEQLAQLQMQRQWAADMLILQVEALPNKLLAADLPERLLAAKFPSLQWRTGEFADARVHQLFPGYGIFIRDAVLHDLNSVQAAHLRMFLSEGGVFLLVVMVGGLLILRTMRHEVRLMQQQANFLSAVTHELKSPLASIRLCTETLQLRDTNLETRARYLAMIGHDTDRLEALVGHLLAVARLEAGQFVVHPQCVDIVQEMQDFINHLQHDLHALPLRIEYTAVNEAVWAMIDVNALHTMMRNVIDNAMKYRGESTQPVKIDVRGEASLVQIVVRDFGIGLPPGEANKIFQKFYRVGNEMVRQTEGSGLGLYLVAALIKQSGGYVKIHSDGLSLGTTVTLTLPRVQPTSMSGKRV